MTISPGTTLGHFDVISLLGVGGMGEVYLARDSKLGREVAIKVLPGIFARDPERLARFEREARLLASLNHPNVAHIYGIEQAGDVRFLELELAPGPTLGERFARGALPLDEVLSIFRQIASALEAAHEQGIIHRDLKPANVKITPAGRVKILDFGLAKAFDPDGCGPQQNPSGTISLGSSSAGSGVTREGMILGTPTYMSPEQARGKEVDKRADIWAFGCMLFEALTGKKAFGGETVSDALASTLAREPEWSALPATTPNHLRTLLRRCLQKEAGRRLRDIGDARIELEEDSAAGDLAVVRLPEGDTGGRGLRRGRRAGREPEPLPLWLRLIVWITGAGTFFVVMVLLGVAAIIFAVRRGATPPVTPGTEGAGPVQHMILPVAGGAKLVLDTLRPAALAVSPDGSSMVYAARLGDTTRLYWKRADDFEPTLLPGTEEAEAPFYSQDGAWICFFAGGDFKRMRMDGTPPQTLGKLPPLTLGAALLNDGRILFSIFGRGGLGTFSPKTAQLENLILADKEKGEQNFSWPSLLPGGKTALYTVWTGKSYDEARLAVVNLETKESKTVVEGGYFGRYCATGHLIFARGGALMAAPFDLDGLKVTGPAFKVLDRVLTDPENGIAHYAFSDQGTLIYLSGTPLEAGRTLTWVDRSGKETPVGAPERNYHFPSFSPGGQRLAVTILDRANLDVWTLDLNRSALTRITSELSLDVVAAWSPDSTNLYFSSDRVPPLGIFRTRSDGSGPIDTVLTDRMIGYFVNSVSADGKELAVANTIIGPTGWDITIAPVTGEPKPRTFLSTVFNEMQPAFSPDGNYLTYISNESGQYEVYVQPYPQGGRKWQISTDGGIEPTWSLKSDEIFYRHGDKMMSAAFTADRSFEAAPPRVLFEGSYFQEFREPGAPNYAVSPDGQKFLMIKANAKNIAPGSINVVLNWFEEIRRHEPAGNDK